MLMGFCLAVALIVAVRGLLVGSWAWSHETPRRRLLGGGMVALVLLMLLFWVPVRGFGADGPPRSLIGIPYRSAERRSHAGHCSTCSAGRRRLTRHLGQPSEPPLTVTTDVGKRAAAAALTTTPSAQRPVASRRRLAEQAAAAAPLVDDLADQVSRVRLRSPPAPGP